MIHQDPKRVVRQGYDRCVWQHAEWTQQVRREEREKYTELLRQRVPEGARILELGCGAGVPTTGDLAGQYAVIGQVCRSVESGMQICHHNRRLDFGMSFNVPGNFKVQQVNRIGLSLNGYNLCQYDFHRSVFQTQ